MARVNSSSIVASLMLCLHVWWDFFYTRGGEEGRKEGKGDVGWILGHYQDLPEGWSWLFRFRHVIPYRNLSRLFRLFSAEYRCSTS